MKKRNPSKNNKTVSVAVLRGDRALLRRIARHPEYANSRLYGIIHDALVALEREIAEKAR